MRSVVLSVALLSVLSELMAEDVAPPAAGDLSGIDPRSIADQVGSFTARLIENPLGTVEQVGSGLLQRMVRTGQHGNRRSARDVTQDRRAQLDRHVVASWDFEADTLVLEQDPRTEPGLRRAMNGMPDDYDDQLRNSGWSFAIGRTVRFKPMAQSSP